MNFSHAVPIEELRRRHGRCKDILSRMCPQAGGILVGGPQNRYYLTGTLVDGLVWLPLEGEPVLAVRKGLERARLESPLAAEGFRSYRELADLFRSHGAPLTPAVAADQSGFSWEQARLLGERLPGVAFLSGDAVLARCRAVKSEWELARIRESCRLVHESHLRLARTIHPGLSEVDIARRLWDVYLELGHAGPQPSGMAGSDILLGHISAGDNGNYPSSYDGPVGIRGSHPAAPVMGHPHSVWREGMILTVDSGFNVEGYLSDRTQIYFAGSQEEIPATVRAAHDACLEIEEQCAAALRPGAVPAEIYRLSGRLAEEHGLSAGFMGLGGNKVRFLGHGIGLTVSEWPALAETFTEPLEEGMVIALEPKVGLPGVGMVGTENTFEITCDGARSLTGRDRDIICL